MQYLMIKAGELVSGLTGIKRIRLYLRTSGRSIPGYTSDLLAVDFKDNTRKIYRYSITRDHFEYIGSSPAFLPVCLSDWVSRRKNK